MINYIRGQALYKVLIRVTRVDTNLLLQSLLGYLEAEPLANADAQPHVHPAQPVYQELSRLTTRWQI